MSAAPKFPKLLSRLTLLLFCGATAAAGIKFAERIARDLGEAVTRARVSRAAAALVHRL